MERHYQNLLDKDVEGLGMDWGSRLLCGWPGLPGLWYRGHFSSLLVAIGFSILLNLALVSSFLWPRSLGETFPVVAWPMILILWITAAYVAVRTLPDLMSVQSSVNAAESDACDTLFIQAQSEYLSGHWPEAEALLRRRLERVPRDVESRLLLATLLRHNRQLNQASDQLDTINKFDESAAWEFEILRERRLLQLIAEHDANQVAVEDPVNKTLLPDNNDGYVRVDVVGS